MDYFQVLEEAVDLHVRKVRGYGSDDDAWTNFRRVTAMGLSPLIGVVVRMNDKMSRINNLIADPSRDLLGEAIEGEFSDMLGYSGIAKSLIKEEQRLASY